MHYIIYKSPSVSENRQTINAYFQEQEGKSLYGKMCANIWKKNIK